MKPKDVFRCVGLECLLLGQRTGDQAAGRDGASYTRLSWQIDGDVAYRGRKADCTGRQWLCEPVDQQAEVKCGVGATISLTVHTDSTAYSMQTCELFVLPIFVRQRYLDLIGLGKLKILLPQLQSATYCS